MKTEYLYTNAKAKLEAHIEANHLRHTHERNILLRHICTLPQPFMAEQLLHLAQNDHISQATVYNSLTLFISARILHCLGRAGNKQQNEYELLGKQNDKIQFVCKRCGRTVDLKAAAINEIIRAHKYNNFNMSHFSLYIYGECKTCKRKPNKQNPNK